MKKIWIRVGIVVICVFALIGFVLVAGYVALELGWTKTNGIIDTQHDYFKNQTHNSANAAWTQGDEWQTLKAAITKDKEVINKAATVAGVPARMIVAPLVVEQLRLFYSDREIFKQIFSPLKILGNQSQFSWGVMGIKQDTARQIEDNLKNTSGSWYLGSTYEHLLDFPASTTDSDTQRFNRLTDEHDRYYSYLYGGTLIKEIETQWQRAGFSIADKPEIIATLFNIGFQNSKPHAGAQVGGAAIVIGSTTYSFGGLAGDFYYSNELTDIFPR
ncbi:MAG: hypothetical protein WCQ60_00590 [bacterium]